ncbi:MAG: HAD-IA family hydrolase [Spirochaetota bacterium]|nr:HAD-IA family hydrolase [Spirochaetota bacterium]
MSKSPFKAVLFDLDGTLVDSKMDIAYCVNQTLLQLGFSQLPDVEVYSYIGNGVVHLMRKALLKALNEEPSRLLDPAVSLFKTYYKEHLLDKTVCYPGVEETINYLNAFKLAVVTNKPGEPSVDILKGLGIHSHFAVILGGDDVIDKKPHPEMILKAVDMLNVSPEETLIVGDSSNDIDSGHAAGVTTCFVTYGFGRVGTVEPDHTVHSFDEISNIIFSKAK